MNNQELTKAFIDRLNAMKPISADQIPNIDLYMDQVTTFMDTYLSDHRRYETDKVLTKTMINNYAKNHLLPPPVNKKYSPDHLIYLIYIYYLKSFLSISDIQQMLEPLASLVGTHQDEEPDMESIYTYIFSNYPEESYRLMKDIAHKLNVAESSFPDTDGEQKDGLQKFTYLCLLAFDIYMKKQLMESIIDDMTAQKEKKQAKKSRHRKEDTPAGN